jgi:molecular chaperone DnaK
MAFLGIDLGTTNSVGMLFDDRTERIEVVKIDGIDDVLPSVVCYLDDEIIVGAEAKNSAIIYPEETVYSIKRKMGETQPLDINGKNYLPEEISSKILLKIKESATEQFGETFSEVVITHPAYFNDRQIYATKQAGQMAGFKTVHLLSEPLAAAIEYGYKQNFVQKVLIYDLGGGTFDACVLEVARNIYGNNTFKELSDVGDMFLGGDDFDQILVDACVQTFEKNSQLSVEELSELEQRRIHQKLKQEAEKAKKILSEANRVTITINPLTIVEGLPYNLSFELTRDAFEQMIKPYIEKSLQVVESALERAGETKESIDKVILVGGSTLIPMVKRIIAGHLKEPYRASDPAKSVAMGAAIYNYLMHLPNSSVQIGQIMRQHIGTRAITNMLTGEKKMIPILKMGTEIPSSITEKGFKVVGGGTAVQIDCFQWEDGYEQERKFIGSVLVEGVQENSNLAITYTIDDNNLFQVSVVDDLTHLKVEQSFDRSKTKPLVEKDKPKDIKAVDIAFVIDTTGSMDIYIEGVKEKAIEFSNILEEKGIEYQLGLIGFGDLQEKEKPKTYKWTKQVKQFQKNVMRLPRMFGGDIPESSLEALVTSIDYFEKRPSNNDYKAIILITDAPPHLPTFYGQSLEDIITLVESAGVICYVVAKKDRDSLAAYTPLTKNGGFYFSMDEPFSGILDQIAFKLSELVRVESL